MISRRVVGEGESGKLAIALFEAAQDRGKGEVEYSLRLIHTCREQQQQIHRLM